MAYSFYLRSNNGVTVFGDFVVIEHYNDEILVAGYLAREKTKVKALGATFGSGTINVRYKTYRTKGGEYKSYYKPVSMGHDRFTYGVTINSKIGEEYILTDDANLESDFYAFLMNNFHLPLLEEWSRPMLDYLIDAGTIRYRYLSVQASNEERAFPLHGKNVALNTLKCIDMQTLTEEGLADTVSLLLREKRIILSDRAQAPLEFKGFDDYVTKYGASIVNNLEATLNPLMPLKGTVDTALLKKKRMYPQQSACVNGILALKRSGSNYGILAEGMGCGKTIQGAAICDAYANEKWLKANPGKTLVDLYTNDTVGYRNIMMAPSHLVEKWKAEILEEIPNAKVTIIKNFSQLIELRAQGKERRGREWYLLSKDFCKLGSQYSPIPNTMRVDYLKARYCAECYTERGELVPITGTSCPDCGSRKVVHKPLMGLGKTNALVCPDCGELLYNPTKKCLDEEGAAYDYALQPKDYASRTKANSTCPNCRAQLWGVDVKPADNGGEYSYHVQNHKPSWYKVSHYTNTAKKGTKSAFVLRGHENSYRTSCYTEGWTVSKRDYGPRKTAPSLFIKKYLKKYFDFCILDECHKYENGGTAQTNAAQSLISVSDFTIGMTGTLMNGKADSLFYLLYLLDPQKMKDLGYEYTDVIKFVRKYGAIETIYEAKEGGYNSCSRGKQLASPRIKPGISPLIVTDFLLEKAVFLDLSDLSKYLPALKEKVVLVEPTDDQQRAYSIAMATLKDAIKEEGMGALSNTLQFGLSYLDKPYDRNPIMSVRHEDRVVLMPENLTEFRTGLTPKEEELVSIVNSEIAEDRNCFIYCTYTGAEETNVTDRLKEVVERECNLKGRVYILRSDSPSATEREAHIKQKATEGIRVFITNPKCVETGLDFCFKKDGQFYNYPTLIFYQVSYELSVMWQASRRGYRLSQTEECRNYYLGYVDTLQASALQIMGEKQVAASAVQGKFSADGLAAMANGVDPRVKLAQMLAEGDTSDRKSLENMFDALSSSDDSSDDTNYGEWSQPLYYEVMGIEESAVTPETIDTFITNEVSVVETEVKSEEKSEVKPSVETKKAGKAVKKAVDNQLSLFDFFDNFTAEEKAELKAMPVGKKAGKTKKIEGQTSLFDLLAC